MTDHTTSPWVFFFKHWNEVGWTRLGTCSSVSGRETWSDDVLFWCFSEYFGLKHSMKQAHGQDQTRNLPKLHRISMISLLISAWFQLCKRLVIHKTKHKFLNKSLLKTTRQVSARFNCSWWDQSTWIPPLGHYEATPARRAMVSAGKGLSWCDVRSNSCWLSNRHRWVTSGLSMTGVDPDFCWGLSTWWFRMTARMTGWRLLGTKQWKKWKEDCG